MNNKTFSSIGGYKIQKEEAAKIADFFKNYNLYKSKGAKLPRGVLFFGVPGTGKTLFANAIANESLAPVFRLTTDDFYKEDNIAISIRKVFDAAKESAPSIVLIDELDRLINCEMNFQKSESDKQREALRALLLEIDRVKEDDVLLIATANCRIQHVPSALVRNGRIEKHIEIGVPDKEDRISILSIYLSSNPIFDEINIEDIASFTNCFSGSSLETLVNDVLIDCIKKNKKASFEDFLEPIEIIRSAGIKKKQKANVDNTAIIYHELGHFITDYYLNGTIGMINVVPYGDTLGRYSQVEKDEKTDYKKDSYNNLFQRCVCLVSGLVATEIFMKEPYMGAKNDLEALGNLYLSMLDNGLFTNHITATKILANQYFSTAFHDPKDDISSHFSRFLSDCKALAKDIINLNIPLINALFEELKEKYVLTPFEIKGIIDRLNSDN